MSNSSPSHSKPAEYVKKYNSEFCILLGYRSSRIKRNAYWLVDIFEQLQVSSVLIKEFIRFQKAKGRDLSLTPVPPNFFF